MDYQLSPQDFLAKYRDAPKVKVAQRNWYDKEGKWIRVVNRVIEKFADKYDVVEVVPIHSTWKVKWKGTKGRNPGKKKPVSVKRVTDAEFDKAVLYIIGELSEEEMRELNNLI